MTAITDVTAGLILQIVIAFPAVHICRRCFAMIWETLLPGHEAASAKSCLPGARACSPLLPTGLSGA
jgi:hypothetical protein